MALFGIPAMSGMETPLSVAQTWREQPRNDSHDPDHPHELNSRNWSCERNIASGNLDPRKLLRKPCHHENSGHRFRRCEYSPLVARPASANLFPSPAGFGNM